MRQETSNLDAGESAASQAASAHALVEKMRTELAGLDLECHCRDTVDDLLDQLHKRLWRQERAQALADARVMRGRITGLLGFLDELDDLTPEEQDLTCFQEIATIFEDLANASRAGAEAARRIAAVDAAWAEIGKG